MKENEFRVKVVKIMLGGQKEIVLPQVKTELKEEFMEKNFLRHNNMYSIRKSTMGNKHDSMRAINKLRTNEKSANC